MGTRGRSPEKSSCSFGFCPNEGGNRQQDLLNEDKDDSKCVLT